MFHVVNLKLGKNDIHALINIDKNDKKNVLPFINTRGELKKDYLFKEFLPKWGEHQFMVDVSPIISDINTEYNIHYGLLDHNNAFQRKFDFYEKILVINKNLIPVVSILKTSTMRDNVQFFLKLQNRPYQKIAFRLIDLSSNSINNLFSLLSVSSNIKSNLVILDLGSIVDNDINIIENNLSELLEQLSLFYPQIDLSIISTSFPSQKTANRDVWEKIPNLDLPLYFKIKNSYPNLNLIYGDYGSTNPISAIDYIPGMQIIPCVTYYHDYFWYQMKTGASHEFYKYMNLANSIIVEPFYHGADYSWGDQCISNIATQKCKYGNSGTWNGIRINQHITSIARMH